MSYSNPIYTTYQFEPFDFGAATDSSKLIQAPVGATEGRVIDIMVNSITETFAASTITGKLQLGDGSDADKYALLNIANTTAASGTCYGSRNDTDAIIIPTFYVSELTNATLKLTYIATTGTPAGQGSPCVIIAWF